MYLDKFTRAYLECMLWSTTDESTPEGGEPMDVNYTIADIADDAMQSAIEDCSNFRLDAGTWLDEGTQERAGHDFWLTRCDHGAGFWDGDWPINGNQLTDLCKKYGQIDPYIGDDGKIYF